MYRHPVFVVIQPTNPIGINKLIIHLHLRITLNDWHCCLDTIIQHRLVGKNLPLPTFLQNSKNVYITVHSIQCSLLTWTLEALKHKQLIFFH